MRILILATALMLPFTGCGGGDDGGGGNGGGGGGGTDMTTAEVAPFSFSKDEYKLTMDLPKGMKAEWRSVYFSLQNGKALTLKVVPGENKDLAKKKESYKKLKIKGFKLIVDEKDALIVEVTDNTGRVDYEVTYNTKIGDTKFRCSTAGLISGTYSKALAEKILSWFRTLKAK